MTPSELTELKAKYEPYRHTVNGQKILRLIAEYEELNEFFKNIEAIVKVVPHTANEQAIRGFRNACDQLVYEHKEAGK